MSIEAQRVVTPLAAMKQALEALESMAKTIFDELGEQTTFYEDEAMRSLRQAIAAAEKQEPVVGTKTWFEDGKVVTQNLYASDIYKDPPQRQQEQKLIGTVGDLFDDRVIAHRKLDRDLLVYIAHGMKEQHYE